jgi:hypothetical protein
MSVGSLRRVARCLLADELGRKLAADRIFKMSSLRVAALSVLLVLLMTSVVRSNAGETSRYMRRLEASVDIPENSSIFAPPPGFNAPQQVHITQGDYYGKAVIVSWVTPSAPDVSEVYYGTEKGNYTKTAVGKMTTYTYYNYTSGFIHHAVIKDLKYDTQYFYQLGQGAVAREFSFFTPPESGLDVPYTFGVIGDLGQTPDSKSTFDHYLNSSGQTLLYVGDLSYADDYPYDYNVRWDTWGRLVEPSTAYQPWIWTAGNHEIEFNPDYVRPRTIKLSLYIDDDSHFLLN